MAFSSCDLNDSVCETLHQAGLAKFDLEGDDESSGNIRAANAVQKACDDRAALLAALKDLADLADAAANAPEDGFIDSSNIAASVEKARAAIAQAEQVQS